MTPLPPTADPRELIAEGNSTTRMALPAARGPLSGAVLATLLRPADDDTARGLAGLARAAVAAADDVDSSGTAALRDDDLQLSLMVLYELHYRGLEAVDDGWEWSPSLIGARMVLESALETALRIHVPAPADSPHVADRLFELTADDGSPSLARFVARRAEDWQVRELLALKSLYQLKEADPHTWAIPRLTGRPKSALIEIQADEYGGGRPGRMHAELFARAMRGIGLDDRYGRYVDQAPVVTLTALNTVSLFGLHRRLRGALVGHLAAYEMTSSIPCRLHANGLRRLGYGQDVTWYFDEHVEADAVHEQIAGRDLAAGLTDLEPALRSDVFFGAAVCLAVEGDVGRYLLSCWQRGESALRIPMEPAA